MDPKKCTGNCTGACVPLRFLIGVSDGLMGRETLAAANHPKTCPAASGHCGDEPGSSLHTKAKIGDIGRRCVPKTQLSFHLQLTSEPPGRPRRLRISHGVSLLAPRSMPLKKGGDPGCLRSLEGSIGQHISFQAVFTIFNPGNEGLQP